MFLDALINNLLFLQNERAADFCRRHSSQVEAGKKVNLFEQRMRVFQYYHTSYIIILKSQVQIIFNFASSNSKEKGTFSANDKLCLVKIQ